MNDALDKWASEVMSRHCWGLGAPQCTLTREQGFNLMKLGYELAEKRGYPNNGCANIGIHPSDDVPLVSIQVWIPEDNRDYCIFFLVDMNKNTARFYSEHAYCNTFSYGCKKCLETLEQYKAERMKPE